MNGEGENFHPGGQRLWLSRDAFHEYANYPGCSNAQWKGYAPEFPGTADFRMGGTGLSGLALTDAGGSFPPDWSDVMLVANPITNRIQAIKMHRDGPRWRLEKLPDVVVSGDEWFRPVAMTLGPDGAVYIVDWYNKIISHNEVARNHPDRDKKRGGSGASKARSKRLPGAGLHQTPGSGPRRQTRQRFPDPIASRLADTRGQNKTRAGNPRGLEDPHPPGQGVRLHPLSGGGPHPGPVGAAIDQHRSLGFPGKS